MQSIAQKWLNDLRNDVNVLSSTLSHAQNTKTDLESVYRVTKQNLQEMEEANIRNEEKYDEKLAETMKIYASKIEQMKAHIEAVQSDN